MRQDVASKPDTDLRAQALERLESKREFNAHLFSYVMINLALWAIWGVIYATSGAGFPWPIFVTFGWGIGVVFHAWDIFWRRPITEEEIRQEEARLQRG